MKALPIFVLLIQYAISIDLGKKSVEPRNQGKAFKGLNPNVEIWNSKTIYQKKPYSLMKIKKPNFAKGAYTAFPSVDKRKSYNVPESPYFPLDLHTEQRSRVKKVLPERNQLLRRFRRSVPSVVPKSTANSKAKKSTPASRKSNRIQKKNTRNRNTAVRNQRAVQKNSRHAKRNQRSGKKTALNLKKLSGKKLSRAAKRNLLNKIKRNARNGKKSSRSRNNPARNGKKSSRSRNNPARSGKNRSGKKISRQQRKNKRSVLPKPNKKRHRLNSVRSKNERSAGNSRRLISGKDALMEDYPYVVSIQRDNEHWCSGAIINKRIVVTTANCVWKSKSLSRLRVRAGSRYASQGGQVTKIQQVMKHPKWNIRGWPDNDIALLLLDRNLKFSHALHAADIPNRYMMPPFDDAWVTSWGSERRDGVYRTTDVTLQKYHARLMNFDKCRNITRNYGVEVTDNFICLSQIGRRGPCTRDTGAPAVSDGVVWGLASWGLRKKCGTERFPAMFTYLGAVSIQNFIINATHILMSDPRDEPFPDRYPKPEPGEAVWHNANPKTF